MDTDEILFPPAPEEKAKPVKTGSLPAADLDLSTLATSAALKWKANPGLTLIWTTSDKLTEDAIDFEKVLSDRISTGAGRPVLTDTLKSLDTDIDKHASYIKTYLADKYGKEHGPAYYPQFGIVKAEHNYIYPSDQDARLKALQLTVEALDANGFNDKTYGKEFWSNLLNNYETAKKAAATTDGTVSDKVKTKNELRDKIELTLNALIHLIRANYPETYQQVLRDWGFQKEKY